MAELKKLDLTKPQTVVNAVSDASSHQTIVYGDKKFPTIAIFTVLIILGVASGFGLTQLFPRETSSLSGGVPVSSNLKVGYVVGSEDEKTFKDSAEGIIEKGGLDGEGSHKLVRPGGPSQTVYLTSSVIDLDEFVGHKVKIWGETFAAQKAGWLMDVGRVEVLQLNAATPE